MKGPEEFAHVEDVLQRALPISSGLPSLLSALQFRDFEVLRYGVGSFFAEHADR